MTFDQQQGYMGNHAYIWAIWINMSDNGGIWFDIEASSKGLISTKASMAMYLRGELPLETDKQKFPLLA